MSGNTRVALAHAQRLTDMLVKTLKPACERIEVAGSIRRKKATVGDIEIVCIPTIVETNLPGQLSLFGMGEDRPAEIRVESKLEKLLQRLVDEKVLRDQPPTGIDARAAQGPRYKKFWKREPVQGEWMQIDLFITTATSWGAIYTIRTGPGDFSKAMVTHIKIATKYRQMGGDLIVEETGEVVPVPEEIDYFRRAGVAFIEPKARSVGALRSALAQGRGG